MNDILDAISARIKAPYFGYALLAFIAMNWRGLFLLAVTEGKPQDRLAAFDAETSTSSLIIYPLLVGAIVAASAAWIRLVFEFISRKPLETIDNLHIKAEHEKAILKTKLERSRTSFFAEKEEELIDRARRDFDIKAIEDEELKSKLMQEIEALRQERDRVSETLTTPGRAYQLSSIEAEMLKAAAKGGRGEITKNQYLDDQNIQVGNIVFGEGSPREFARYEAALESLALNGLVKSMGDRGNLFQLTNSGWQLADAL
jgi:hypothetical protein